MDNNEGTSTPGDNQFTASDLLASGEAGYWDAIREGQMERFQLFYPESTTTEFELIWQSGAIQEEYQEGLETWLHNLRRRLETNTFRTESSPETSGREETQTPPLEGSLELPGSEETRSAASATSKSLGTKAFYTPHSSATDLTSIIHHPPIIKPPECLICFEPFTELAVLVPCGHKFDQRCIFNWFKVISPSHIEDRVTCPLCRRKSDTMQIYNLSGEILTFDLTNRPHLEPNPMPSAPGITRFALDDQTFFNYPRVTPQVACKSLHWMEPERLMTCRVRKGRGHRGPTRNRRIQWSTMNYVSLFGLENLVDYLRSRRLDWEYINSDDRKRLVHITSLLRALSQWYSHNDQQVSGHTRTLLTQIPLDSWSHHHIDPQSYHLDFIPIVRMNHQELKTFKDIIYRIRVDQRPPLILTEDGLRLLQLRADDCPEYSEKPLRST